MSLVLTVEDTNRLRERLGLRLIPVPIKKENNNKEENGVKTIQLSILETNKIRQKLGLKLLPEDDIDEERRNYIDLKRKSDDLDKIIQLKTQIENTKNQIRSNQVRTSGGILDKIDRKNTNNTVMDFDAWLDTVGADVKKGSTKKLKFKSKKPKKIDDSTDNEVKEIKVIHDKENFSEVLSKEKEIVLTATDSHVLDDKDMEFENHLLKREIDMKNAMKNKESKGDLVSLELTNETDTGFILKDGDNNYVSPKRKLESLNLDIDSDEHSGDESKKLSSFLKRDVSKFKKSKKNTTSTRKVFDTTPVTKEFNPLVLEEFEDEDDVEELDQILKIQRKTVFSKPRSIKREEIKLSSTEEKQIFDERVDFIEKLQVDAITTKQKSTLEFKSDLENDVMVKDHIPKNTADRYLNIMEAQDANHNTYGVSHILNALKNTGEQASASGDGDDVKITYTDDDGNVLSTKDAFKYMSRKFHGSKKK